DDVENARGPKRGRAPHGQVKRMVMVSTLYAAGPGLLIRSSPMHRLSRCLLVCVVVGSLGLVGCATVLRSRPVPVTITSEPPEVHVTVTNLWTGQRILQATTPVVAPLARHAGYMRPARDEIAVEKPGYQLYVIILQAELEKQYVGNVAVRGPLGF